MVERVSERNVDGVCPSELVNQTGNDCLSLLLAVEMPHWVGMASFSTLLLSSLQDAEVMQSHSVALH